MLKIEDYIWNHCWHPNRKQNIKEQSTFFASRQHFQSWCLSSIFEFISSFFCVELKQVCLEVSARWAEAPEAPTGSVASMVMISLVSLVSLVSLESLVSMVSLVSLVSLISSKVSFWLFATLNNCGISLTNTRASFRLLQVLCKRIGEWIRICGFPLINCGFPLIKCGFPLSSCGVVFNKHVLLSSSNAVVFPFRTNWVRLRSPYIGLKINTLN